MSRDHWKNTGWYLRAESAVELFTNIALVGAFSKRTQFAWRGMRSIDYLCDSSLIRGMEGPRSEARVRQTESRVLREARDWGLGYGPGGWASDLQLLADLQHYGTSTRLIDVSTDPMTALWFACQPALGGNISTSGVLLAINTAEWPRYGRSEPHTTRSSVDDPMGWELNAALSTGKPFVVESLNPNQRLRAQSGYFVSSSYPEDGPSETPFSGFGVEYEHGPGEELPRILKTRRSSGSERAVLNIPFIAIRVHHYLKEHCLEILANSYNRSHRTIYPDLTGFRDHAETPTPRASEFEQLQEGRSRRSDLHDRPW